MKQIWKDWKWLPMVLVGCLIVAVGFDMFLLPNGINGGGLSGLAMVLVEWTGLGTVGILSIMMNVPLFILGGKKIGKKFFFESSKFHFVQIPFLKFCIYLICCQHFQLFLQFPITLSS